MSTYESKENSILSILSRGLSNYFKLRFVFVLVGIVILAVCFILIAIIPPKYTETTDVANYGNYSGTCSDSFVNSYITSFFPMEIDQSFSNITYSYKAENTDSYGFEAYLEFHIEDTEQFDEYVSVLKKGRSWQNFDFWPGFQECNLENVLVLDLDDDVDPASIFYRQILCAKIRKILYSSETQTIIYVAIGVYDGGGIGTNYLNTFFDRFQIDPAVYMRIADTDYNVDPYSIN